MIGLDPARAEALVYLVAVLLGLALLALPWRRLGAGRVAGYALGWVAIFGGAWWLIERTQPAVRDYVEAATRPEQVEALAGPQGGEVRVRAAADGHFWVQAQVNGQPVRFLVDTGASDVVLSRATAARVGIDMARLRFDRPGMGAGGVIHAADARVDRLVVGPIVRERMPVAVLDGRADINLLGMRFLRSLDGWRVERGELVLAS